MIEERPRRETYLINDKHKETQIRKVKLYMGNMTDSRGYLYDGNWNHKKTNAQKAMYSCGGYGGKCPTCKRGNWDRVKERKSYYELNGVEKHFF